MKKIFRVKLAMVVVALCSTLVIAQSGYRQGDAFHGPVKTVRIERTSIRVVGDSENESPPVLIQEIVYSRDGLSREIRVYNADGSIRQKTIETYRADGTPARIHVVDGSDKTISTHTFERDQSGRLVSETRHNGDGSVKDRKFVEWDSAGPSINSTRRIAGDGRQLETSVVEIDSTAKTSNWRTANADGSRTEQIASRDSAGNHRDEVRSYAPDGTLIGRSISIVDTGVTRKEATLYDGAGNVKLKTLETREYDHRHNLIKSVNYRWNNELQKFQPSVANYARITYFDTTER
jgi:YD repeat-containing protein